MKKILYFIGILAIAALAAGCQKEAADTKLESNLVEVTFTTATQEFAPATKTHLGTEGENAISVEWDADDKIAINGRNSCYELTNEAPSGTNAILKGEVAKETIIKDFPKTLEMAIYPVECIHAPATSGTYKNIYFHESYEKSTLRSGAIFKTDQVLTANNFDKTANISVAVFDINTDTELYFLNICSLFAIKLQGNAKIKSIEITSSERALSGVAGIQTYKQFKGANAAFSLCLPSTYAKATATSKTVRLIAEDDNGIDITSGTEFYACVFPFADGNVSVSTPQYVNLNSNLVDGTGGANGNTITIKIIDVNNNYVIKTHTLKSNVHAGTTCVLGNWTNVNTDKFTTPVE